MKLKVLKTVHAAGVTEQKEPEKVCGGKVNVKQKIAVNDHDRLSALQVADPCSRRGFTPISSTLFSL